jgi:hypothetical protein
LLFADDGVFLKINDSMLLAIRELSIDAAGYLTTIEQPYCKEKHPAFMKVEKLWLCFDENCKYYYIRCL